MMNTPRSTESDFSRIRDLVRSTQQRGPRLAVQFECPATGKAATVTVDVVAANDNALATKARSRFRTAAIKSVQRSVTRTLRSLLGNNVVGKLAGEVVSDKAKAANESGGFTDAEMETAILSAFAQVQDQFAWQPQGERYVHRSAQAEQ